MHRRGVPRKSGISYSHRPCASYWQAGGCQDSAPTDRAPATHPSHMHLMGWEWWRRRGFLVPTAICCLPVHLLLVITLCLHNWVWLHTSLARIPSLSRVPRPHQRARLKGQGKDARSKAELH